MVAKREIKKLVDRIVQEFHPERVILFGSHARGDAGKYSDVDLLVILRFRGNALSKVVEIWERVQPAIPTDIFVHTPQQFRKRLELGDSFLREVAESGEVLYETPDPRVGAKN